jgi:octaprenyl-diphosphate synthase
VLDVEGDRGALGKSAFADLREGKLTLPVLYALEARPSLRARLTACVEADNAAVAAELAEVVVATGAAERARADAAAETQAALAALATVEAPAGAPHREALAAIAGELCRREA